MVITDHHELLALERALGQQAYRDRKHSKYHNGDAAADASADLLEAMLLRMYEEHFPVAGKDMRERMAKGY